MKSRFYDIDALLKYCVAYKINISPQPHGQWAKFCWALKVLNYDESFFVALSNRGAEEAAQERWSKETKPGHYLTEYKAVGFLIHCAKESGLDLAPFRLSAQNRPAKPSNPHVTPLTPNIPHGVTGVTGVTTSKRSQNPKQPPVYIEPAVIEQSARAVSHSTLYKYLCSVFPESDVQRVLWAYKVGATKEFIKTSGDYGSAFPFINAAGQVVDVHLMSYAADGHRRKDCYSHNWLLSKRAQSDHRAPWCLFGEHLLSARPTAPVGIVESEKTAIIAALHYPAFVWCATASSANLTAARLSAAKDRSICVYPDMGTTFEQWKTRCAELATEGFRRIRFCGDTIAKFARGNGDDLADIILREITAAHKQPTNPTTAPTINEPAEVEQLNPVSHNNEISPISEPVAVCIAASDDSRRPPGETEPSSSPRAEVPADPYWRIMCPDYVPGEPPF